MTERRHAEDRGTADCDEVRDRLATWFARRLAVTDVRIDGLGRLDVGHSAEMIGLTVMSHGAGAEHRRDVVIRLRPGYPDCSSPTTSSGSSAFYGRSPTGVKAPRALWMELSPDVLGRPFFVMERAPGEVYEREVPEDLGAERVRRLTEDFVDELAQIHLVDLEATGLGRLGDGREHLARELDRWEGDMRRVHVGRSPRGTPPVRTPVPTARALPPDHVGARRCQAGQLRLRRGPGVRRVRLGTDRRR